MSIWTENERIHVGIMVAGKRIHRRLPPGASKSDAKLIEAELRRSAGRRDVTIPDDPPLAAVMNLYIDHAQRLRSPKTAEYHALRAGPWCVGHNRSAGGRSQSAFRCGFGMNYTGNYTGLDLRRGGLR